MKTVIRTIFDVKRRRRYHLLKQGSKQIKIREFIPSPLHKEHGESHVREMCPSLCGVSA